jgi:hypothetical protein
MRSRLFPILFWVATTVVVAWLLVALSVAWAAASTSVHDTLHRWGGGQRAITLHIDPDYGMADQEGNEVEELAVPAGVPVAITVLNAGDPQPEQLAILDSDRATVVQANNQPSGHAWTYQFTAPGPGLYTFTSERRPELHGRLQVVDPATPVPAWIERVPAARDLAMRMATASHVREITAGVVVQYVFSVVNLVLAIFLMRVRPRDPVARLLAVGMLGTAAVFNWPAHASLFVLPALVGQVPVLVLHELFHLGGMAYLFALVLFPDGRLPHWSMPGWRRLPLRIVYLAVFMAAAFELSYLAELPLGRLAFFGVLVPLAGITAQLSRYRHATDAPQRHQTRVLLLGLSVALMLTLLVAVVLLVLRLAGPSDSLQSADRLGFEVFPPLFAVIPVMLVAVMVRYRLWDMDRIINRTLVYGVLTGILALLYLTLVVVLGQYIPVGRDSPLAVAASTLAVAALFRPLRDRIQVAVDRRFYRHKYDAAETVAAFSGRLREHIDLDTLTGELLSVVNQTVEPTRMSLWLRRPRERTGD